MFNIGIHTSKVRANFKSCSWSEFNEFDACTRRIKKLLLYETNIPVKVIFFVNWSTIYYKILILKYKKDMKFIN
jgi:hypothetical protein